MLLQFLTSTLSLLFSLGRRDKTLKKRQGCERRFLQIPGGDGITARFSVVRVLSHIRSPHMFEENALEKSDMETEKNKTHQ